MEDERRAILSRVARGEITPEEGAALLEEIGLGAAPAATDQAPRARRVRILRSFGQVDVIGDGSVQEAVAEGPHMARREGDALVIEGEQDSYDAGGFTFAQQRVRINIGRNNNRLRVRINPDLPLEVESRAGSLRIAGMHGPIRVEAQAGSTRIEDFRGPLDLSVQAGSVQAEGVLDHGDSRISCEAGSVRLNLLRGSSVRIRAHATLGKVSLDGAGDDPWRPSPTGREAVVGDGRATLALDAAMGNVRIASGR